jgi:hypothetical protein
MLIRRCERQKLKAEAPFGAGNAVAKFSIVDSHLSVASGGEGGIRTHGTAINRTTI